MVLVLMLLAFVVVNVGIDGDRDDPRQRSQSSSLSALVRLIVVVAVDGWNSVGNVTDMSSGHEEAPSVEDDANTGADIPKIVKITRRNKKLPGSPIEAATSLRLRYRAIASKQALMAPQRRNIGPVQRERPPLSQCTTTTTRAVTQLRPCPRKHNSPGIKSCHMRSHSPSLEPSLDTNRRFPPPFVVSLVHQDILRRRLKCDFQSPSACHDDLKMIRITILHSPVTQRSR